MSVSMTWQKLRVPVMEKLALTDMAVRHGKSEEDLLAELIREAVKRDLSEPTKPAHAAHGVDDDQ